MVIDFDLNSVESYNLFLKVKSLPRFKISGRTAIVPDEYAHLLGVKPPKVKNKNDYVPESFFFDYQRDIARLAVRKKKFALFIRPGWGKTPIFTSFARYAQKCMGTSKNSLIISPLMVIQQTIDETKSFYGDYNIEQIAAKDLQLWLKNGDGIGITNFEAIKEDLDVGKLGQLIVDEAQMLKSHYGKWGTKIIDMGKGLEWKMTSTGTPAPNDRIEYANQAVFLDVFPNVNSFLARYFVNRGNTGERWELKPHALDSFYRQLSAWSIFMNNPATFGWKDNAKSIPPIEVHIQDVELTQNQFDLACKLNGSLLATTKGGIGSRASMAQIAKGIHNGKKIPTNKPTFIRSLVDQWINTESTIIWCHFNREHDEMENTFPEAVSMRGSTPYDERLRMLAEFKNGTKKVMITKTDILGAGQNLQVCTRMVFNGLNDSYEDWCQAIHRANRVGSTKTLHVYVPTTDLEKPMVDNVLRKAKMVEDDANRQEEIFNKVGFDFLKKGMQ